MVEPPELWAFVLANTGVFIFSSMLAALSYLAYRQSSGQLSYRFATLGFGLVVLGGLVEPAYLFGVSADYRLNATELLVLQAGEAILLASGLGILFYAITRHGAGSSSTVDDHPAETDEEISWRHDQWVDD